MLKASARAKRMITEPCLIAADVDKTLLEQLPSQREERNKFLDGIAPHLISGADIGSNLAILTGNSMDQLCRRFLHYLIEQLCVRRQLEPLSNFHFFCQSGGVYFHFSRDDAVFREVARQVGEAPDATPVPTEAVTDALTMEYASQRVAHPRFIDQSYLKDTRIPEEEASMIAEIVEAIGKKHQDDLIRNVSKYREDYLINSPDESNRSKDQEPTTESKSGMEYELYQPSGEIRRPYVQGRPIPYGLTEPFETASVQITLRPILSFRHAIVPVRMFGKDVRSQLIEEIQSELDIAGLPQYQARPGGRSSIDITKDKVDKGYALEKLIDRLNIHGVSRKGQKLGSNAMYLGDEVIVGGGNDYPVTRIPGLTVFAVNEDRELIPSLSSVVVPSTVFDGPDAVAEVLSSYIGDAKQLLKQYTAAEEAGEILADQPNAIDALTARVLLPRIKKKIERLDVSSTHISGDHLKVMHALVTLMCRDDEVSRQWLSILVDQLDKILTCVAQHAKESVKPSAYGASSDEHIPKPKIYGRA